MSRIFFKFLTPATNHRLRRCVRRSSLIHNIAWPRFRRGRPVKAARYALRASRSVVVSLSLSRRNAASESERTAILFDRKSTSQSALLTAPLSGEPLRTAICGLRRNGLTVGTAPTHKAVGRVFFVVRRTMATGYLQTARGRPHIGAI